MKLSVIIPTRNRAVLLAKALTSLRAQTLSQSFFEVVVIDNGSTDSTADVANSFKDKIKNIRYFLELEPGLHAGRNRGLHEAKSDLLVYADDDIEACPGWLEGIWSGFSQNKADMVGGRNLPLWECEPPPWLMRLWCKEEEGNRSLGYLSILDLGTQVKEIDPLYVWGCNFSIRKEVLLEAGGFHPDSMPHDLLHFRGDGESYVSRFVAERGYKAVYVPLASVYHFVPRERMTVEYFRKRAFAQGVSDSYTFFRQKPSDTNGRKVKLHPLAFLVGSVLARQMFGRFLPSGAFVRANINHAYRQGLEWHRNKFMAENEVRNWVLKKNYIDAGM